MVDPAQAQVAAGRRGNRGVGAQPYQPGDLSEREPDLDILLTRLNRRKADRGDRAGSLRRRRAGNRVQPENGVVRGSGLRDHRTVDDDVVQAAGRHGTAGSHRAEGTDVWLDEPRDGAEYEPDIRRLPLAHTGEVVG